MGPVLPFMNEVSIRMPKNTPKTMALLSSEVVDTAQRSVLCWLASVGSDGQPNVSPKEIYAVFDDSHIVIANIASPASVRNTRHSAKVCLSFVDIFVQKGFKIHGLAENIDRQHPDFPSWAAPLLRKTGTRFPIHSVIVVRATAVEPIVAPSYKLYPDDTTEQGQIAAACLTYGVVKAA